MGDNIGYIVIDGQFVDLGKSITKNLFTGGILVPQSTAPGIVYSKIKEDIFERSTNVTGVKNEDALLRTLKNLHNITFEKGSSSKYKNMDPRVRAKFDANQWWSFDEVLALKAEYIDGGSKDRTSDTDNQNAPARIDPAVKASESQSTSKENPSLPEDPFREFSVQMGEEGPIICINQKVLEMHDIQDQNATGAVQAVIKILPGILKETIDANKKLLDTVQEANESKKCAEEARRETFDSGSKVISLQAELTRSLEEIRTLEMNITKSELAIKSQQPEGDMGKIDRILDNVAIVKTAVERLVNIYGQSLHRNNNQDLYHEAINNIGATINLFLSEKSNNRLLVSEQIMFKTISAESGPVRTFPSISADIENFICSIPTPSPSEAKGFAVFLVEAPKKQSGKSAMAQKIKTDNFVNIVKLLVSNITSMFETPVFVAVLPSQDEDLKYAIEMEQSLLGAAIPLLTVIAMNTILDRSVTSIKNILSSSGRAKAMSVIRTLSEVINAILVSKSLPGAPKCSQCGGICKSSKCIGEETQEIEIAENKVEPDKKSGPITVTRAARGKSLMRFCWVCGEGLADRPHVENNPCRGIGIHCLVCKAYGHVESTHHVTDADAIVAMKKKYGDGFRFYPTTTISKQIKRKGFEPSGKAPSKKPKQEDNLLSSDED